MLQNNKRPLLFSAILKQVLLLVLTCISSSFSYVSNSYADNHADARLLLLFSYHPNFPTSPQIYDGLMSQISSFDLNIDVDVEYMDSKRLYTEQSVKNFHQALSYKIENKGAYDYIVTSDDNALSYVLDHQYDLFADTPIIFLGVNNLGLASSQLDNSNVTGVIESSSIEKNLTLGQKIFPEAKDIYLIIDGTTTSLAEVEELAELRAQKLNINWHIVDLTKLSWEEFANELSAVEDNKGFGILVSAYRDKNGISLDFDESWPIIAQHFKLPILHLFEFGIGDGILGGVVNSYQHQLIEAGKILERVIHGESPANITIQDTGSYISIFDQRELDKLSISHNILPANAVFKFEHPKFIDKYGYEAIVVLLVIVLLMACYLWLRTIKNHHLQQSERKLRSILDNIDSYVYLKDKSGRYLFANKSLRELFNSRQSNTDITGLTDFELYDLSVANQIKQVDTRVVDSKSKYTKDESFVHEGVERIVRTTKVPLLDERKDVYALCGVSTDITAQVRQQRILEQTAYYDKLTGLPNKLKFIEKLTDAMLACRHNGASICIALFDLDNFKKLNDLYGSEIGDKVLTIVLRRIAKLLDNEKMELARIGGDEFQILCHNCCSNSNQFALIVDSFKQPVEVDGETIYVTASGGITHYPQQQEVLPEQLFRQAEQALYHAKNSGRNRVEYYAGDDSSERAKARKTELLDALKDQLVLHYQPKINLITGQIAGAEALVRWQHPSDGLLYPDSFLDDMEALNLIKKMDEWVLDTALQQAQEWYKSGIAVPVSINLSHLYFRQLDLEKILAKKLAQYPDLPAGFIEIEIVETGTLENLTNVASIIEACKRLGLRFSLDDFGTGYSSLTYLQRLPVDTLKVDKSFVINMLDNPKDLNILKGILDFCKAFQLTSVAEGVESIEHGDKLQAMGYEIAQGFGIARPMPVQAFEQWVSQWTPPSQWNQRAC